MDITDRFLHIAQTLKSPQSDPYKNRFIVSEVSSTESHYISETSSLLFLIIDSSKVLEELSSESSNQRNFHSHSDRIRKLSEKAENNLKILQLKLEELQPIELPTCCSGSILELLQKRLFLLTKDFQLSLQRRTKQLRNDQSKKTSDAQVEYVNKDRPTFLEEDDNEYLQHSEDLSYLQNRAQSVEQVEKQMTEVAEMMQKIAMLVHEQQSTIDRIDMQTEQSVMNLQNAKSEIDKYYTSVTSNRNLGIKVFMIFVMFFVFYVVFLV